MGGRGAVSHSTCHDHHLNPLTFQNFRPEVTEGGDFHGNVTSPSEGVSAARQVHDSNRAMRRLLKKGPFE